MCEVFQEGTAFCDSLEKGRHPHQNGLQTLCGVFSMASLVTDLERFMFRLGGNRLDPRTHELPRTDRKGAMYCTSMADSWQPVLHADLLLLG